MGQFPRGELTTVQTFCPLLSCLHCCPESTIKYFGLQLTGDYNCGNNLEICVNLKVNIGFDWQLTRNMICNIAWNRIIGSVFHVYMTNGKACRTTCRTVFAIYMWGSMKCQNLFNTANVVMTLK